MQLARGRSVGRRQRTEANCVKWFWSHRAKWTLLAPIFAAPHLRRDSLRPSSHISDSSREALALGERTGASCIENRESRPMNALQAWLLTRRCAIRTPHDATELMLGGPRCSLEGRSAEARANPRGTLPSAHGAAQTTASMLSPRQSRRRRSGAASPQRIVGPEMWASRVGQCYDSRSPLLHPPLGVVGHQLVLLAYQQCVVSGIGPSSTEPVYAVTRASMDSALPLSLVLPVVLLRGYLRHTAQLRIAHSSITALMVAPAQLAHMQFPKHWHAD